MRLIDADKLINTLGISDNDIYCKETIEEYILDNGTLSFAESERKKGRWIEKSTNGEMFSSCSVCGYIEWDAPRNFCLNCGADMREGEEE